MYHNRYENLDLECIIKWSFNMSASTTTIHNYNWIENCIYWFIIFKPIKKVFEFNKCKWYARLKCNSILFFHKHLDIKIAHPTAIQLKMDLGERRTKPVFSWNRFHEKFIFILLIRRSFTSSITITCTYHWMNLFCQKQRLS